MVNIEGVKPESVAVVPASTTATVVLDGNLPFGPAPQFSIALGAEEIEPVQIERTRQEVDTTADRVLSSITASNVARAHQLERSVDAWLQAGFAATASEDYETAVQAFDRALSLDPKSRDARLGVARVRNERGDVQGAVVILRDLLAASPGDTEVRVGLAIALTGQDKFQEALELLQTTESPNLNNASLFAARGAVNLRLRNYRDAISDLRKVVRLKPDWVHARNSLGIAELKEGHAHSAERHFREAARVGPLYPEAPLNLLRLLKVQKRWRDLVLTAEERWSPDRAPLPVAMLVGDASLVLGDYRAARIWFAAAKEKIGDSLDRADILNNLGVSLFRLDKPADAGKEFEEAAHLNPSALTIANRAKAYMQEGKYDSALEWLGAWQDKIEFNDPELLRTLAHTLFNLGQFDQAVKVLQTPEAASPNTVDTQALLSMVYSDGLLDYEAAIEAAKKGLEVDPEDCALLNNLAYALLEAGRVGEAEDVLRRVDDSKAAKTTLVCLAATRGLLAMHRGRLADGLAGYERALSLSPYNSLRERVKVKRDLEAGRAMLRLGYPADKARTLLLRAAKVEQHGKPYSQHARDELARLPAPKTEN